MKSLRIFYTALAIFLMSSLSSCDFIGDVFEAGFWTAIIVVILFVAIIIWIIRKFFS